VAPYRAVTDRNVYAKPALPSIGLAGSSIVDPVFQTSIRRVTDNLTRPGTMDRSYRTPSSPHQNAWSANGSYFYVTGSGGVGPIPFAFDPSTGTATRIAPSASGDGGFVLQFYIEPQFSYVGDSILYGSYSGPGSTLHTVDQYDFSTGTYSRLLDLETLEPGLTGTYIGGVASSAGPTERIEAFFGGTSQDRHRYVVVFDRANPQNRQIVDTVASTINGQPSPVTLNFNLHHVMIDRSGRYVMLYTTGTDQAAPRYAAPWYLWDLDAGTIAEIGAAAHPSGHDAFGYGVQVNQDCCIATTWDAAQWQFRDLSSPLATRDLIRTVLTPKEVFLSDHTTWNNALPDRLVPVVSGLFRYGTNTVAWRPWDDEIVAIQTDAQPGVDPTVWRFAHHRSDITYDGDPTRVAFWYEPRPNVSHDGRWILFTSNWEKTLGVDAAGDAGTGARQDVFLLALTAANSAIAIATGALPAGRPAVPYTAALSATGGSGGFVWSAAGLPAGLSIDSVSGTIAGTPGTAGTSTVTVTAADAANPSNSATATFTIAIAASVTIASPATLPDANGGAYAYAIPAANVVGTAAWSVQGGALPRGITLDPATGVLGGLGLSKGTYSFSVRVSDASTSDTLTMTLTVRAVPPRTSSRQF
jgi:hypothetical protein